MKTNIQRANNIIGQLEGLKKLLESDDKDCFELINQLKAIKSATTSLLTKVVRSEFDSCLADPRAEKEKILKIFEEIAKK